MSELQTLITNTSLKSALNKGSPMLQGGADKTKAILRHRAHRCSQNCQRHRFTLSKIRSGRDKGKFVCDKYSASHIFCPHHNEQVRSQCRRLKIFEGGAPRFNNDRRVETPAFILKFQVLVQNMQIMPDDGSVYKERFKDFLARATNETLETSDQKCRLEYQRRCLSKGRYPEFQRKVEELRGMLTGKDERTAAQQ